MTTRLRYQVAFLTGQSHPNHWALSPAQSRFLSQLNLPEEAALPLNFPYRKTPPEYMATSILRASISNSWMYLYSRTSAFRDRYKLELMTLLARADQTIFLAGSCGLEILLNLRLQSSEMERVRVFAFGPVARSAPACAALLVQGRRDWISRQFFPNVDHLVECSHMDYLSNPEVLALCKAFVTNQRRDVYGRSAVTP